MTVLELRASSTLRLERLIYLLESEKKGIRNSKPTNLSKRASPQRRTSFVHRLIHRTYVFLAFTVYFGFGLRARVHLSLSFSRFVSDD